MVALTLFVKREIEVRFKDPFTAYLGVAVGYWGLVNAFRDYDCVFNPALAAAGMSWQALTWFYEPNRTWNGWTGDLIPAYILGPIVGGFMAGHLFNQLKRYERKMNNWHTKENNKKTITEAELMTLVKKAERKQLIEMGLVN